MLESGRKCGVLAPESNGLETEVIQAEYLPIEEAIRMLNIHNRYQRPITVSRACKNIFSIDHLDVKKLDNPIFFSEFKLNADIIVKRGSITEFLDSHIRFKDAFKQTPYKDKKPFLVNLRKKGLNITQITQNHDLTFLNKEQFEEYLRQIEFNEDRVSVYQIEGYYTQRDVCHKFGISKVMLKQTDIYKFRTVKSHTVYYPCQAVDNFHKKLIKELEQIREDYYLLTELDANIFRHERTIKKNKIIESLRVPQHLQPLLPQRDRGYFYKKESIIRYYKQKENEKKLQVEFNDPYDTFKHRLNVLEVVFPAHLKQTEALWNVYTKDYFNTQRLNIRELRSRINNFVYCTQRLAYCTKEIYDFSASELNLLFFNQKVPRTHRERLYPFIQELHEHLKTRFEKTIYNMSAINNPFKESIKSKEKTVYDYDTYMAFWDYANNIELHKKNALADVKNIGTKKYNRYDSAWLYALVHLNNAWRHTDVTEFPRIDLRGTEIRDLEWLEHNDISEYDARRIIGQIKSKMLYAHKTGAKRHFFCSQGLLLSIATAVAICEFRTRMDNPASETLIDFKTTTQSFLKGNRHYVAFFKGFNRKIKFESLKMNRTLLSLAFTILSRGKSDIDALEVAKYLRDHADVQTTNIYILIPQDHLDFITAQLFDRDSFGHIPNTIAELLCGSPANSNERTKQIQTLKEKLGSIYKMENFARFLNEVMTERVEIKQLLSQCTKKELMDYDSKIKTHQLPAKNENYQCLVSPQPCVYQETDCSQCILSIPNFYALSAITQRLRENLLDMRNNFPTLELESDKCIKAKQFHYDMLLLKDAVEKFGHDVVFDFMEISHREFKSVINMLPSIKKYIEKG